MATTWSQYYLLSPSHFTPCILASFSFEIQVSKLPMKSYHAETCTAQAHLKEKAGAQHGDHSHYIAFLQPVLRIIQYPHTGIHIISCSLRNTI
jgi:hypothetical protein